MSLTQMISSSLTGLSAAQASLKATSDNVANVNTEGYARASVQQSTNAFGGVTIEGVERIVNDFLIAASRDASSDASAANALAGYLDRIQMQFGTTDDQNSIFGQLNQVFDSIAGTLIEGSNVGSVATALSDIQSFFDEVSRLSGQVDQMMDEIDELVQSDVSRVNQLLEGLADVNTQMRSSDASGVDVSAIANQQAALLDELSTYMDITIDVQSDGRTFVKTSSGLPLLDNTISTLSYDPSGSVEGGRVIATSSSGSTIDITVEIGSGSIGGLLQARNTDLPELALQLAEFASGAADLLNEAHNNASAYPALNTLTGRNTGLLGTDAITGTGTMYIAVVDTNGDLVQNVQVDVSAAGFSVNGGAAGATIDDLVTDLNTALGGNGTASFVNGVLSITASNATDGIATVQDETSPSDIGGRGLSHFFGLNDLVTSTNPGFFETGTSSTSAHGLTGGQFDFTVYTPTGKVTSTVSIAVTGTTIDDQLTALNSTTTGVGGYGTFSLDGDGQIVFTPNAGFEDYDVVLTNDSTERGTTGISFSEVFGMGDSVKIDRGTDFDVNADIVADTSLFAMGTLAVTGASVAGDEVLATGDRSGAEALLAAYTSTRQFDDAGSISSASMSLQDYAGRLASDTGARAASAERAMQAAESLKLAADEARAEVEGVNLDEELANMSLYQQAYNASARLLQAADEMFETLINIV